MRSWKRCALALVTLASSASATPPTIDLAFLSTEDGGLLRAFGSDGDGSLGVPVAAGFDVDGDDHRDYAFAAMQASPFGRLRAGQVYLLFGDGAVQGTRDTAVAQPDILVIGGDQVRETAGSEIWMDDVTGDGVGDLLIARQNHSPAPDRIGAGALSIVVGGPALRAEAETLAVVDLRTPPETLVITTLVGAAELDRLGIWMRTGDVTGDGVADIVVGADQASEPGEAHRGVVYVIRGGEHLAAGGLVDLLGFGESALPGHIARVRAPVVLPPADAAHYHFGGTVQIADLDGNGRAEVIIAATLNRAGAALRPDGNPLGTTHSSGGTPDGTLYIAWDDNFLDPWGDALDFAISAPPGSRTVIDGAACNRSFGEEILGGLDYDDDGLADLFVGDIVATCSSAGPVRTRAGSGDVFFDAGSLRGMEFDLGAPPALDITHFDGAAAGDIAADTALHGDFDGDGIADLSFSAPHGAPLGRASAGLLYVFYGSPEPWPTEVDLAALPGPEVLRITQVYGAAGSSGFDTGDTLGYSAAAGDMDRDGTVDLVTNEMVGNGVLPAAEDAGNLIILSLPEPVAPAAALLALVVVRRRRARLRAPSRAAPRR